LAIAAKIQDLQKVFSHKHDPPNSSGNCISSKLALSLEQKVGLNVM